MLEPVLVVHGVANRDPDQFEAQVKNLNERVGTNFNFIAVYWGDLGANVDDIDDTLPAIPGIVPNLLDDLVSPRTTRPRHDPRSTTVEPYRGTPVTVPTTIQSWTNLWEPMDPLAFIAAKIFVLDSGHRPSDLEVDHTFDAGLWTHSAYWTNAQVEGQIRVALT
jgi:hypothetical protein